MMDYNEKLIQELMNDEDFAEVNLEEVIEVLEFVSE